MRLWFDPWPRSVGEGSSVAESCGVGRRCGSDLVLLWLWCRGAAVALIRLLAWEPPYAMGVALKSKKNIYIYIYIYIIRDTNTNA